MPSSCFTCASSQRQVVIRQVAAASSYSIIWTRVLSSFRITYTSYVLQFALNAQVYCLEIEPYMLELAQPKFEAAGVSDRIEVLVGSASDSIDKLRTRGQRFDIAFLDADKSGYLGYYSQLMDNQLINPGGIIVVDNALMKVAVIFR